MVSCFFAYGSFWTVSCEIRLKQTKILRKISIIGFALKKILLANEIT